MMTPRADETRPPNRTTTTRKCPAQSTGKCYGWVTPSIERPSPRLIQGFLRAAALFANAFLQRAAAISNPADGRQDAAAQNGRDAGGVECLHGLLPGRAPRRVCVLARDDALARVAAAAFAAPRRTAAAVAGPPDRDFRRRLPHLGRKRDAGVARAHATDARGRLAVPRRLDDRAPVATLVRRHGTPIGQGPVLPLCGEQSRQHAGAGRVPAAGRT